MMHATCSGAETVARGSTDSGGTRFHVSQPALVGRGVEQCECGSDVHEHEIRVVVGNVVDWYRPGG